MTVLSLQWRVARPRRPLDRRDPHLVRRAARCRPDAVYPDVFFADPAPVEDDARRMRHGTNRAAPQPSWPASQWRLPD